VKDADGDLLADRHSILNSLKSYFSQLLNTYDVKDVKETEMRAVESLVPPTNHSEVEIARNRSKKAVIR
jgi:hypothetical protein